MKQIENKTIEELQRELRSNAARYLWRSVYRTRREMESSDVIQRVCVQQYLNKSISWDYWKSLAKTAGVRLVDVINATRI